MTARGRRRAPRSGGEIPIGMARRMPDLPLGGLLFRTCQWPLWDDRPDGRFCAKPVLAPGLPYCAEHQKRAHTKIAPKDIA